MEQCYCGNDKLSEYSSKYYKCSVCSSLVSKHNFAADISQVISEEKDLYGSNYWENVMVKEAGVKDLDELIDLYIPERASYWLKYCLQNLKLGARVAEAGCGLGQFSYLLKSSGFHPVSFELSPQICKYIEQRLGLETICGELRCSSEKYHAVIAIDVFEHLTEPERFLEDCCQRLESGGILVLQMPCYDPECTYEEMLVKKPRFRHLLVEDQHVYLYSRDAITRLLEKYGFTSVVFEPAFFGDDYDMFLFASAAPLRKNTPEEIDQYLNGTPNGRIVKAMLKLFDEKNQENAKSKAIDEERNKILKDISKLNQIIKEREEQSRQYEMAAEERLADIKKLTIDNGAFKREADRRLADVERLAEENKVLQEEADKRLAKIEQLAKDNMNLKTEADKRLADVERLAEENTVLQTEADKRLADIERLTADNKILQTEADKRLADVKKLVSENEMLAQAAKERLEIIERMGKTR